MSAWTDHVKRWASANGKSYSSALRDPKCQADYKASKPPKSPKVVKTMKAATMRKYVKGDIARENLLKFQEAKMKRQPIRVGTSPEPLFGMQFLT